MGFDVDDYRKTLMSSQKTEEYRKQYSNRKAWWPFVHPGVLDNGTFRSRFIPPHPEKCEQGFMKVATHRIQEMTKARGGDSRTVACNVGTDEDCAICETLNNLIPLLKTGKLSSDVEEAIRGSGDWTKVVFPMAMALDAYTTTDKNGKETTKYRPGKAMTGVIFSLTAEKLLEEIGKMFELNPNLSHLRKGRDFAFIKNGTQYKIELAYDQDELENAKGILAFYPDLPKIFSKNTERLDYEGQLRMLGDCWWMDDSKVKKFLKGNTCAVPWDDEEEDERPAKAPVKGSTGRRERQVPDVDDDDEDTDLGL